MFRVRCCRGVQGRIAVRTESLSQAVCLDVVVNRLRDLCEACERSSWVSRQHRENIINDDALFCQRVSLAHLDFPLKRIGPAALI